MHDTGAEIQHLDFTPAPLCEGVDMADLICHVTAEWLMVCLGPSCNESWYVCHEDKLGFDNLYRARTLLWVCPACKTQSTWSHPRHQFVSLDGDH